MNICSVFKFAGLCLAFATVDTVGQFIGMGVKHAVLSNATETAPQVQQVTRRGVVGRAIDPQDYHQGGKYYVPPFAPQPVCTQLPCPARKVAQHSLPKSEVGKVIRVADTINKHNQRAAHAGE